MTSMRIAMWSGPRNISTAMMRAFENRPDTEVWDEPFYGPYLYKTGLDHPGAEEVIADQGTDWEPIAEKCVGGTPNGAPIFYQKHMTMHMLPHMGREWIRHLTNCFLIREPERVAASYNAVRERPSLEDLGFVQQAELFDYVIKVTGTLPMVIDSRDFLFAPEEMLIAICAQLGIPYRTDMIAWPEGQRESDGVWGKHWYDSVWRSTGFAPANDRPLSLSAELKAVAKEATPYYEMMYQHRITI